MPNYWSHSQTINKNCNSSLHSLSECNGWKRCVWRALRGNTVVTTHCNIQMPWFCPGNISVVQLPMPCSYCQQAGKRRSALKTVFFCEQLFTKAWNQQFHNHTMMAWLLLITRAMRMWVVELQRKTVLFLSHLNPACLVFHSASFSLRELTSRQQGKQKKPHQNPHLNDSLILQ